MKLALASVFSDHMVLQQGIPVSIWGTATPGARVVVEFHGQRASTKPDETGRWKIRLDPMAASAKPDELIVTASAAKAKDVQVNCRDVLVGEVWVCSGQSNMEWSVALSRDADKETAAATHPLIRLLSVPRIPATEPATEISSGKWAVCSPDTVWSFSAAGYYFGRELHRKLGVPIGLINASVGGTPAETWVSREGYLSDPSIRAIWEDYERDLPQLGEKQSQWQKSIKDIDARTRDTGRAAKTRDFAGLDEPSGDWSEMTLPGNWQSKGLNFSGIVWFRKTVEIPAAWAGKDLELGIGATDKNDLTFFNNQQVGSVTMADRLDAWSFIRAYPVPGALVKSGRNVIAVRVHSDKYNGGMTGPSAKMYLSCPSLADSKPIPLAGAWSYTVEANYGLVQVPPQPLGPGNMSSPTQLFNGMIAPLTPMSIRGAIWYQGESNADRARVYRDLFPALIQDWRNQWGLDNLAFYFVQLANYMEPKDQPGESTWAELREAQTMTLRLPHTGMAVVIDIGEANNIHPLNKQDVGLRLAVSALHQTYGLKEVVPSGPLFREVKVEGKTLRVYFDHVEGGLTCRGKNPEGFAIAGTDRKFVWADGRIDGNTVIVSTKKVPEPRIVRYAWADNPPCNLCNGAGLPASPFRSDVD